MGKVAKMVDDLREYQEARKTGAWITALPQQHWTNVGNSYTVTSSPAISTTYNATQFYKPIN